MNIESFLRYLRYEKNFSSYTALSYKTDLQQFEDYRRRMRDDADVMPVETDDVRNWIADLSRQGVSPRSISRKISALRSYFRYATGRNEVSSNPMIGLALPKNRKTLPSFVRPEAMNLLLDSECPEDDFDAIRNRLILEMLYETGMRRAELIGLRDAAVDNSSCEVKVRGKRNKERIIPYGARLQQSIDEYRTLRNAVVGGVSEAFFVRKSGQPLYPQLVYRVVREALSGTTSLSKRSPHVLRHSFASALLNDGAGINSVKELLGHNSLASTEVYTHITFEELKQSYTQAHPRAVKKGGHYGR